jgi:hypothetical protein
MTAPFRGSGPWRGRSPFRGRGPWAGKGPFGFNAGGETLGPELVTNGAFDSNTTGWTAGNSSTLSAVGGRLRIANGTVDYGQAYQSFSVVNGRTYRVSIDGRVGTSSNWRLIIGGSSGSATILGENFSEDSDGVIRDVVANVSTLFVTIQCNTTTDNAYVEVDNISVREVL